MSEIKTTINWFPGHMAKARRMMEESLRQMDVVVEIVDARAPMATRNPDFDQLFARKKRVMILNKADLAKEEETLAWKRYFQSVGYLTLPFCAKERRAVKQAVSLVESAAGEIVEKQKKRGIRKTVRAMVVGIPNVGKSTFINALRGSASAKTGDQPGVTRGKQWIIVHDYLEFLDTPGLLWPKLENQELARHLAYIGSINDEIYSVEEICKGLLETVRELDPDSLAQRLKTEEMPQDGEGMILCACRGRGFLGKNGEMDTERAARVLLDEFRSGKMGRITLEKAPAPLERTISESTEEAGKEKAEEKKEPAARKELPRNVREKDLLPGTKPARRNKPGRTGRQKHSPAGGNRKRSRNGRTGK